MNLKSAKIVALSVFLALCMVFGLTAYKESLALSFETAQTNQKVFFDGSKISNKNHQYLCADLLETYAQKPDNLVFIGCKVEPKAQVLAEAIYEVSGENSVAVENFLVQTYGMGKLVWLCCGYESRGQYGAFDHEALTAISPYVSGIITMSGSGEVAGDAQGIGLEFDRNKILFTVFVSIVEV